MNKDIFINILEGKVYRLICKPMRRGKQKVEPLLEWVTFDEIIDYYNSSQLVIMDIYKYVCEKYINGKWAIAPEFKKYDDHLSALFCISIERAYLKGMSLWTKMSL